MSPLDHSLESHRLCLESLDFETNFIWSLDCLWNLGLGLQEAFWSETSFDAHRSCKGWDWCEGREGHSLESLYLQRFKIQESLDFQSYYIYKVQIACEWMDAHREEKVTLGPFSTLCLQSLDFWSYTISGVQIACIFQVVGKDLQEGSMLTGLGKAGLGESKDKVILGPFSRVTICLDSLDFLELLYL